MELFRVVPEDEGKAESRLAARVQRDVDRRAGGIALPAIEAGDGLLMDAPRPDVHIPESRHVRRPEDGCLERPITFVLDLQDHQNGARRSGW